jgi:hypothetical protein
MYDKLDTSNTRYYKPYYDLMKIIINHLKGLDQVMISKDDTCVDRNGDNGIRRLTALIKKKNNNDNNFVNNNFVCYGIRLLYMLVAKFNIDVSPIYDRIALVLIKTMSNISSQFKGISYNFLI